MSKAQSNIVVTLWSFYFIGLVTDVSAREVELYNHGTLGVKV